MKKLAIMFGLVFAFAAVASAQTVTTSTAPVDPSTLSVPGGVPTTPGIFPTPPPQTGGIDKREKNQKDRIKDGVKDGDLTFKETGKLLKQQAEIRKFERKAKADGTVSVKERFRLHRELNQANRNIRRKKNN